MLPATRAEIIQEFLLPQGRESVASLACGFLPLQKIGRL